MSKMNKYVFYYFHDDYNFLNTYYTIQITIKKPIAKKNINEKGKLLHLDQCHSGRMTTTDYLLLH